MYVTQEQILEATNGGLDIILHYYPQAGDSVSTRGKKFKTRESEKTASASLKLLQNGVWVVTDFGGDQKSRNGIFVAMEEERIEFKAAIQLLASRFNVAGSDPSKEATKPLFEKRPAREDEEDGKYIFVVKGDFTEMELRELFSKKVIEFFQKQHKDAWAAELQKVCVREGFYALTSFTYVKDRIALITSSTETYPIFIIEGEGFKKIYQPKSWDKSYRFRYEGKKPENYIFGYKRLIKKYNDLQEENIDEPLDEGEERELLKLDNVMICSGDRDSLNASALGYNVIWLNSETDSDTLSPETYLQLRKMCENIYNVPDLDDTGQREGHRLALKYLELKTVQLPAALRQKTDFRKNPCKDLRDYLNHFSKKSFDDLVKIALPYQFWDIEPQYTRAGEFKGWGYQFNNVHAYNFLMKNGFYRFKIDNEKEGYIYVQVKDNIVKQIRANDVKAYINQFIEDYRPALDIKLRNTFYKSTQLSETSLSNLKETTIDFEDYGKDFQYMFFINKTWKITKDGIEEFKPGEVGKYVWDQELIKHRVKKREKPFTISVIENADGSKTYDIEIHDTDCLFLKYLINTCRVHWRKEYEEGWTPDKEAERLKYIEENKFNIAGPRLSQEEIAEQKHHLVNHIYAYGYLLHRYKDPSRPWCVFAMDHKISEEGESHGGSGKSIAFRSLFHFMNWVRLDGRNRMLTKNPHVYENVTEHTDYVLIDDGDQYLDFNFFFAPLTGELTVNPKNNKQYTIPFEKVPKFAITSNYTLRNLDPSTLRRILFYVCGDYYHYNPPDSKEYNEARDPKDDFGKNLFSDFTEDEWNYFINVAAYCCSAYMNYGKIDPPMDNVNQRNLLTIMNANLKEWADVYFAPESGRLNEFVPKTEAFDDFMKASNQKGWSSQRFNRSIEAWCLYYHYEHNPIELHNKDGRVIRRHMQQLRNKQGEVIGEKSVATEMIFIKTSAAIGTPTNQPEQIAIGNEINSNDDSDLPY